MIVRKTRIPGLAGLLLLGFLSACDNAIDVTREYPSTLGGAAYLKGLPDVIPVHFDSVPEAEAGQLRAELDKIAVELSRGAPVRFAFGSVPDGRDFSLRVAFQPKDGLSALTLCQGRPIGRTDARQRSLVAIAAVCSDRRRLGEVRAIFTPKTSGDAVSIASVADAAVRKLFALPDTE